MRPHALLAVFLVALAPAQRTWIVNKAGGAGVDFTDIPPAIAAAAVGDTVRVIGGANVSYSPFTLSKGLNVETLNGASIVPLSQSIVVTQVPAGGVARISGFRTNVPFEVGVCAGNVVLSGLILQYISPASIPPKGLLKVTDCASVLVTDTRIKAPDASGGFTQTPNDLLAVWLPQRSRVVLQRCSIFGSNGLPGVEFIQPGLGGTAIQVVNSTLIAVDSFIAGGSGADAASYPCGTSGGHGLDVQSGGSALVFGRSSLWGGLAGVSSTTSCPPALPGKAATGPAWIASDVMVTGVLDGGAARVRSLGWLDSPGVATLGAPVTVTLRGTPLTTMLLHIDEQFGVTPLPPLETPYLGTLGALYVAPFVIGSTGALPFTFTVPYLPQCAGRMYFLHALAIEPGTNALSFTNLGDLLLR